MSTLSPIDNLTVNWYVVGWGTKQGRFYFFNKMWKPGKMCISMFCCLNFTCKDVQIKWKERYLAHVDVIAKTANEIKRLFWMCSNRWLPPSLPWCWVHSSFPFFYTNFSQQFMLWSQRQDIIFRNIHTAFTHASKASKANKPFSVQEINVCEHALTCNSDLLQGDLICIYRYLLFLQFLYSWILKLTISMYWIKTNLNMFIFYVSVSFQNIQKC